MGLVPWLSYSELLHPQCLPQWLSVIVTFPVWSPTWEASLFLSHHTLKTTQNQPACEVSQSSPSCTNSYHFSPTSQLNSVHCWQRRHIFPTCYISKRFLLNNSFSMWKGVITRKNCTLYLEWPESWRQRLSLINRRLTSNDPCFTRRTVQLTNCYVVIHFPMFVGSFSFCLCKSWNPWVLLTFSVDLIHSAC